MRSSFFGVIGFAFIFMVAGVVFAFIRESAGDPEVIRSIAQISTWAASNVEVLSWVVAGAAFITVIAIPPVLVFRRRFDDDRPSPMDIIGVVVLACVAVLCVMYLLAGCLGSTPLPGH